MDPHEEEEDDDEEEDESLETEEAVEERTESFLLILDHEKFMLKAMIHDDPDTHS